MEDTAQADSHDSSTRAFAAAVEQFRRLLQTLTSASHGSTDFAQMLQSLSARLAAGLESWLRRARPFVGAWFAAQQSGFVPAGQGTGALSAASLPPLQALLGDLARLQSQLMAHWTTIAQVATRNFVTELG